MKIPVLIGAALASAALLAGCGEGPSQRDLPQEKVTQIEPEGTRSYHSPDRFPNVVTYCIVGGHRIVLNTRDFGEPVVVIPRDESCGVSK